MSGEAPCELAISSSDDDAGVDTAGKRTRAETESAAAAAAAAAASAIARPPAAAAAAAAGAGAGAPASAPAESEDPAAKRARRTSQRIANAAKIRAALASTASLADVEHGRAVLPHKGPHPLDFDPQHLESHQHGADPALYTNAPVPAVHKWKRFVHTNTKQVLQAYRAHIQSGKSRLEFPWREHGVTDAVLEEREFQRTRYDVASDADDDSGPGENSVGIWVWRTMLSPMDLKRYRDWKALPSPKPRFDWHTVAFLDAAHPLVALYNEYKALGYGSDAGEYPLSQKWVEHQKLANAIGGGGAADAKAAAVHSARVVGGAKRDGPTRSELAKGFQKVYERQFGPLPDEFHPSSAGLHVLSVWAWPRYTEPMFAKHYQDWVREEGDDEEFEFNLYDGLTNDVMDAYAAWAEATGGGMDKMSFERPPDDGIFHWRYWVPPQVLKLYASWKELPAPKERFPWFILNWWIGKTGALASAYETAVEQGIPSDTEEFPVYSGPRPSPSSPSSDAPSSPARPTPAAASSADAKAARKGPPAPAAASAAPAAASAGAAALAAIKSKAESKVKPKPKKKAKPDPDDDDDDDGVPEGEAETDLPDYDPVAEAAAADESIMEEARRVAKAKHVAEMNSVAASAVRASEKGKKNLREAINPFLVNVERMRSELPFDGPDELDFDEGHIRSHAHVVDPTLDSKIPVPLKWKWGRHFPIKPETALAKYKEHVLLKKFKKETFSWTLYGVTPEVLAERERQRRQYGVESDLEYEPPIRAVDSRWRWRTVLPPKYLYLYDQWKANADPFKPRFDWHIVPFLTDYHPHLILRDYKWLMESGGTSDTEEEPLHPKWLAEQRLANAGVRIPAALPADAKRDGPIAAYFAKGYEEKYGHVPEALQVPAPTKMPNEWFWRRHTGNPDFGKAFVETRRAYRGRDRESVFRVYEIPEDIEDQFDHWKQQRGRKITVGPAPRDGVFRWKYWIPPRILRLYQVWKAIPEPKKHFPWFILSLEMSDPSHVVAAYADAVKQGEPSDTEDFEPLPDKDDPRFPAMFREVGDEEDEDGYDDPPEVVAPKPQPKPKKPKEPTPERKSAGRSLSPISALLEGRPPPAASAAAAAGAGVRTASSPSPIVARRRLRPLASASPSPKRPAPSPAAVGAGVRAAASPAIAPVVAVSSAPAAAVAAAAIAPPPAVEERVARPMVRRAPPLPPPAPAPAPAPAPPPSAAAPPPPQPASPSPVRIVSPAAAAAASSSPATPAAAVRESNPRVRRRTIPMVPKAEPNGPIDVDFLPETRSNHWEPPLRAAAAAVPPGVWNWTRVTDDMDIIDAYDAYVRDNAGSLDAFPWDLFGVPKSDVDEFRAARAKYDVASAAFIPTETTGVFRWRDWLSPAELRLYRQWRALPGPKKRFPWFLFPRLTNPESAARAAYTEAMTAGAVSDAEEEPDATEKRRSPSVIVVTDSDTDADSVKTIPVVSAVGTGKPAASAAPAAAAAVAAAADVLALADAMVDDPSGSAWYIDEADRKYPFSAAAAAVVAMRDDAEPPTVPDPLLLENDYGDADDDTVPQQHGVSISVSVSPEFKKESRRIRPVASPSPARPPAAAAAAAAVAEKEEPDSASSASPPPAPMADEKLPPIHEVWEDERPSAPHGGSATSEWTDARDLIDAFTIELSGLRSGQRVRGVAAASKGVVFEYSGPSIAPDRSKLERIQKMPELWRYLQSKLESIGATASNTDFKSDHLLTDIYEVKGKTEEETAWIRFATIKNKTILGLPAQSLVLYSTAGAPISDVYDAIILSQQQSISHFFKTANWSIQVRDENLVRPVHRNEVVFGASKPYVRKGTEGNGAVIVAPGVAISFAGAPVNFRSDYTERMRTIKPLVNAQLQRRRGDRTAVPGPFQWLYRGTAGIHVMARLLRLLIVSHRSGVFDGTPLQANGEGLPTDVLIYALVRKMWSHPGVWENARLVSGTEILAGTLIDVMIYDVLAPPEWIIMAQSVAAVAAVDPYYCMQSSAPRETIAYIAWDLYANCLYAPSWPQRFPEEPDLADFKVNQTLLDSTAARVARAPKAGDLHGILRDAEASTAADPWAVVVALNTVCTVAPHPVIVDYAYGHAVHEAKARLRNLALKSISSVPFPRNDPVHLSDAIDNVACPTMLALSFDGRDNVVPVTTQGLTSGPFSDLFTAVRAWRRTDNPRRSRPRRTGVTPAAAAASSSSATVPGSARDLIFGERLREAQRRYWTAVVLGNPNSSRDDEDSTTRPAAAAAAASPPVLLEHRLTTQELCVAIGAVTVLPKDLGERKALLAAPVLAILDYSSADITADDPKPRFHIIYRPGEESKTSKPLPRFTPDVVAAVNSFVIRKLATTGIPWSKQFRALSPALSQSRIMLTATNELKAISAALGDGAAPVYAERPFEFAIKFKNRTTSTPWKEARLVTESHATLPESSLTTGYRTNPLLQESATSGVTDDFERHSGALLFFGLTQQETSRFVEVANNSDGVFRMPSVLPSGRPVTKGGSSGDLVSTHMDAAVFRVLLQITHRAPGILGKRVDSDGEIEFTVRGPIGLRLLVRVARKIMTATRDADAQRELSRLEEEARATAIERSLSSLDVAPAPAAGSGAGAGKYGVMRKMENLSAVRIGWGPLTADPNPLFKQQSDALARFTKRHAEGYRTVEVLPPASGKTRIAREACAVTRSECTRIYYATPLAAMSGHVKEWAKAGFQVKVFTRHGPAAAIRKLALPAATFLKPNELPREYTVTFIQHKELADLIPFLYSTLPRSKVVIDEVHEVANGETADGKAAVQMFLMSQDSIALTATLPIKAQGMKPFFNAVAPFHVTAGTMMCLVANLQREAVMESVRRPVFEKFVTAELTETEQSVYNRHAPTAWGGTKSHVTRADIKAIVDVTREACLRRAAQYAGERVDDATKPAVTLIATDNDTIKFFQTKLKRGGDAVKAFDKRNYVTGDPMADRTRVLILNYKNSSGFDLSRFAEKVSLVEPSRVDTQIQLNGRFDRPAQLSPVITHTWVVDSTGVWMRIKGLSPFPISKDGAITELTKLLAKDSSAGSRPAAAAAAAAAAMRDDT